MKKRIFCMVCAAVLALAAVGCADRGPSGNVGKLSELKGRVVYSIGKGQVPDLVLRSVLKQAGVPYEYGDGAKEGTVVIKNVSDGTAVIGGLRAGQIKYGVLGEPAATNALNAVENTARMFDLQQLYGELKHAAAGYPQAVLVVKRSFLTAHPGYVRAFADALAAGSAWAETNAAVALAALKGAGSTQIPTLTDDIAKRCNVGFTAVTEAKASLAAFFGDLDAVTDTDSGELSPVGGSLPDDDFYAALPTAAAETGVTANVYAPDGAPAITLSKLIADGFDGASFHIVAPAQIGGMVANGNADIAIMPSNAAATLYNQRKTASPDTAPLCLAVTSFGNLYLIGKTE